MDARRIAQAVCPGIVHAQVPYTHLLRRLLVPEAHWLDLGCGHQAIRPWVLLPDEDEIVITQRPSVGIGIDQDLAALRRNISMPLRVAGDIQHLPFADASFDVITANMVLEHVHDPQALLNEVGRVLRPGGIFVFLTPNKYFPMTIIASLIPDKVKVPIVELITNRREHDIYPTQYRINTHSSISHFAQAAGFDIDRVELVENAHLQPPPPGIPS